MAQPLIGIARIENYLNVSVYSMSMMYGQTNGHTDQFAVAYNTVLGVV